VRTTNYGTVFDVRPVADPDNLADSALALGPHTDNPYRDPVPTLQVLHCLRSTAVGGDTTLVDGFAAAATLAGEDPGAYALLSEESWRWRWSDVTTELETTAPVIETGRDGSVRQIRYNERSRCPAICLPEVAGDLLGALAQFAVLVADPARQTRVRLRPGDALITDNRRTLHGRTAFASGGERHLQGAYADMDGLRSTLAVLRRGLTVRRRG
jgi:gamma-butyrobetaine dioxygenase